MFCRYNRCQIYKREKEKYKQKPFKQLPIYFYKKIRYLDIDNLKQVSSSRQTDVIKKQYRKQLLNNFKKQIKKVRQLKATKEDLQLTAKVRINRYKLTVLINLDITINTILSYIVAKTNISFFNKKMLY